MAPPPQVVYECVEWKMMGVSKSIDALERNDRNVVEINGKHVAEMNDDNIE